MNRGTLLNMEQHVQANWVEWLVDGQPDWNAITSEITCSRCGYDLRMLVEPRCPECGLEFTWPEVLSSSTTRNDFLFEHTCRSQPVRSWLRTVWHSVRPRHFWSRVSIHNRIYPKPLLALILLSVLFPALLGVATLSIRSVDQMLGELYQVAALKSPLLERTLYHTLRYFADTLYPLFCLREFPLLLFSVPILVLLLMFVVVASLRQTLGRCRIRTTQILRVVAYAAVPASFVWCAMSVGYLVIIYATGYSGYYSAADPGLSDLISLMIRWNTGQSQLWALGALVFLVLLLAVPAIYLHKGLKHYLRLPHAGWVALSALVITALSVPLVFLAVIRPLLRGIL